MPVTPSGILTEPLVALRNLVASSATFQVWTGTADATAAADRVHLLVAPVDATRPYALIDFGDITRERSVLQGGRLWQTRPGSTMLLWFQADGLGVVEPDASIDFCNKVGAIWEDMEKAAGNYSLSTMGVSLIDLPVPPQRTDPEVWDSAGDYFECCLSPSFTRAK